MKAHHFAMMTATLLGTILFAACSTTQGSRETEDLKMSLRGVCMKQMQEIASAMLEYREKNGTLPKKPSDLKGYITARAYDGDRLSWQIFISPVERIEVDREMDPWAFADANTSYTFHSDADLENWRDILLSEKKPFLWPDKKIHVAVGGHAMLLTDAELKKYLENGKL